MLKNDMYQLPDDFIDFVFMPKFTENIENLASIAVEEDWKYHNTPSTSDYPILENYIKHTYKRIAEEQKVEYSKDGKYASFDTGLLTRKQQEPIYIMFTINKFQDCKSYWHFHRFARRSDTEMISSFEQFPDMANYYDEPTKLVYDYRKPLIVDIEHIIEDNRDRFDEPFKSYTDYQLKNHLDGCVDRAKERVRRNYKIAVPQYYKNKMQLLLPLCISSPEKADMALVVEDFGKMYKAFTSLTLDMAINNARLLATPDRNWLKP